MEGNSNLYIHCDYEWFILVILIRENSIYITSDLAECFPPVRAPTFVWHAY